MEYLNNNCNSSLIKIPENGIRRTGHYRRPEERPFLKKERPNTTILLGGLTWTHEKMMQGTLGALGYCVTPLSTPDMEALRFGKEFCNNGQCNPTYFTAGSLINFLFNKESEGMSRGEIIDRYVFLTASSCGPCRFGMYEAEYRNALMNAGFDGFRVIFFEQTKGLKQSGMEAGLEMNPSFFLALLNATLIGDLLNGIALKIRPFENNPGETDRVITECAEQIADRCKSYQPYRLDPLIQKALRSLPGLLSGLEFIVVFVRQIFGNFYTDILREYFKMIESVEIDPLRVKPVVKITGEFWAQTTDGDGNFRIFRFLEREGAQAISEPIFSWILYMTFLGRQHIEDRLGLKRFRLLNPMRSLFEFVIYSLTLKINLAKLNIADGLLRREWDRYNNAFGAVLPSLSDQRELQTISAPYYNSRSEGGEGHLEVAKNLYYHTHRLSHMVISVKPFGCLPSTQSDAVQASILNRHPDMIFLPIETSGEGQIHAYSRIQMALSEARSRAIAEYDDALNRSGFSQREIETFLVTHPELKRSYFKFIRNNGMATAAANYILHLSNIMHTSIPKSGRI